MQKKILIALAGKAGAGKSTIANHLVTKFGFKRCFFAEPIYNMMYYFQEQCGFEQVKERDLLQQFGALMRMSAKAKNKQDPVLRFMEQRVSQLLADDSVMGIVIDDLRMPQELEWLQSNGFNCFRLVGREHASESMSGGSKNHVTEIALDNVDLKEIDNQHSSADFVVECIFASLSNV